MTAVSTLRIEPATPADAQAVAEVQVLSWQQAYRGIFPDEFLAQLSVERRTAMWRDSIATGRPQVLVARIEDRVAGFIACGPCRDEAAPDTTAEVWAFYLAPDRWSTGMGRALWQAARERMLLQGAHHVSLWVIATNPRAIRFYLAAGFCPEPGSIKPLTIGGVQVQEERYVQELRG
jgi:ribosomal protein S18 acetylase RimI-like enzyme